MKRTSFLFLLLAGCASSTANTDASTTDTVDTSRDVPSTTCAMYTAGDRTRIASTGLTTWTVKDAVSANDGTWVLIHNERDVGVDARWRISVLDSNNTETQPQDVSPFMGTGQTQASLAFQASAQRGVATADGNILLLNERAQVTRVLPPPTPPNSFPLDAPTSAQVTRTGVSVLAEQVRGAWGASLLSLDVMGNSPQQMDIGLPGAPPESFRRDAVGGGDFVTHWVVRDRTMQTLSAQRRIETGMGATPDPVVIHTVAGSILEPVIAEDETGLRAFWIEQTATGSTVKTRALRPDATPTTPVSEIAMSSPTSSGLTLTKLNDLYFLTGVMGSGVERPVVFVVNAQGVATQAPITVPNTLGARITSLRIAWNANGPVVFYTELSGANSTGVWAVPIRCAP